MPTSLLEAMGGEEACRRLSAAFYRRVGKDPILHRLFPGKSLKCATEEFAAFLIQFLGGDEDQTQRRWWLSLRESHGRFQISELERTAWLQHMAATLEATGFHEGDTRGAPTVFLHSSAYVVREGTAGPEHPELAARWSEQRLLDDAISAITAGHNEEATVLALRFRSRPMCSLGCLPGCSKLVALG